MQKKFITNLALLLFLNFLIKPFWIFGIDRTVQNSVSPEEYGTYFALFNFAMLFNILLDFGITNFNNKNIAQHQQLLTKYFSGIVVLKLFLAILYFITTFVVGYFVGYDSTRFKMMLFLSFNQFLISFIQNLVSNVSGLQMFRTYSFLSVMDRGLMILFCSVLLWSNIFDTAFKLMDFVYAQTLSYSIVLITVFTIVLLKVKKFTFKFNKALSILILKQTYPYALLVLTMTFYYRLDSVMLDLMLEDGERQASIYAQAYRLMDAGTQMGVMFASLLLPMFANMIKNKVMLDELVKLSFSLIFVPAIVIAIFSFSFSLEIMDALYTINVSFSAPVFGLLMTCFVAIASTYIFGTLLTANGSLKLLNSLAIGGMILNFILNLILIPKYNALGSAMASLITQFLIVFLQIIAAKRLFSFRVNYRFIISILVYLVLVISFMKFIELYIEGLSLQFLVFITISGILSVVMGIINIKKIVKILVNKEA